MFNSYKLPEDITWSPTIVHHLGYMLLSPPQPAQNTAPLGIGNETWQPEIPDKYL